MTRKLAFSVWPDYPPGPSPTLQQIRERSVAVLEEAGYEIKLVTEIADHPAARDILKHMKPGDRRHLTKLSDLMRVVTMCEELRHYDEVLYFDYDMLIFESPSSFGVATEMHLQQDRPGGPVSKLWVRGVNAAYNLSSDHLPAVMEHADLITSHIAEKDGKVNFAYPMNYMAPIEDEIGYIENYWLFGSLDEPLYCSSQKIMDSALLWWGITGSAPPRIGGVNMMGSRTESSVRYNVEVIRQIRHMYNDRMYSFRALESAVRSNFEGTKKLRLRPNYNTINMRQKMKEFCSRHRIPT